MNIFESYFTINFGSANNYLAGMNFTNLVVALPIIATLIVLLFNICAMFLFNKLNINIYRINYILFSITIFVFVSIYFAPLYSPMLLSFWLICGCIMMYASYNYEIKKSKNNVFKDKNSTYLSNFVCKLSKLINDSLQSKKNNISKNVLINGSWGAGKSCMAKDYLAKSIDGIYITCSEYANINDLINDLIKKTNNWVIRLFMLISLNKLISMLGNIELKQYVGVGEVIILDDFERLIDYNKIDPMHIVSLIQYLNIEKKCVCIIIANDNYLTDDSKFINTREKLVSQVYSYSLPYEEAINIISKTTPEAPYKEIFIKLKKWYQLDNNIRMLQHILNKILELYNAFNAALKHDLFMSNYVGNDNEKKAKLFMDLFGYVDIVVIPLYYLYLKNPNNLTLISKFTEIYHQDNSSDKLNKTKINSNETKNNPYFLKDSIQNLACKFTDREDYKKNGFQMYVDAVPCFFEIQKNDIFANIPSKLITDYLSRYDFIARFIESSELIETGIRENIIIFMQKFKSVICENDEMNMVVKYFGSVRIFEERFLSNLEKGVKNINDSNFIDSIVDLINYINSPQHPVYTRDVYINALLIASLFKVKEKIELDVEKLLFEQIQSYYYNKNNNIINLFYEDTIKISTKKDTISNFINLMSGIRKVFDKTNDLPDYFNIIEFLDKIYYHNKHKFSFADLEKCNNQLIDLLTDISVRNDTFISKLFVTLTNLNENNENISFSEQSYHYLFNKFKSLLSKEEISNTIIPNYINSKLIIAKTIAKRLINSI